jgi:hypothetical protein
MAVTWKFKGRGMYGNETVNSSKYFISNNCVSCGWGNPALQNKQFVVDFSTYKDKWCEMYEHVKKWGYQGIHHLFESVKEGDFVWTRLDGVYYVARIPNDPIALFYLDYSDEAIKHDCVVQLKNIKWVKCGTEESVLGSVSSYTSNRNSLVRVDKRESIQNGFTATSIFSSEIINPDNKQLIKDRKMILNFLGFSGFEDLIAIWLFDKYNYFVIPSTNKMSTQKYEFVLVDGTRVNGHYNSNKRIYLQAKNGQVNLNIKDYLHLMVENGDEVWLATSGGTIYQLDEDIQHQIVCCKKTNDSYELKFFEIAELIDFVFNKEKQTILPKGIQALVSLFE